MAQILGSVELAFALVGIIIVWSWLRSPTSYSGFPPASSSWPILRSLESLVKGKNILEDVYRKQRDDGRPYALRGVFGDAVVLPPSMLSWLVAQPEYILSAKQAQMNALMIPITFLRSDIGLNPVHEPLVRRNLTAHLSTVTSELQQEVALALEELWGTETSSWRKIDLDHTIRRVVARSANRIFVGPVLCRDSDFIESAISYVGRVSACGLLLKLWPVRLRGAVGFFLTIPIKIAYASCARHLLPAFSRIIRSRNVGSQSSETGLFSHWLVANSEKYSSSSSERSPDFLCRRILALNFAAIHTSTLTTTGMLLDYFSSPVKTASMLREEANCSESRWGETWNRSRLNEMTRIDSTLRESLRLGGLLSQGMTRQVVAVEGVTLPNGQQLSLGMFVCVSGRGLHRDGLVYPKPCEFMHDRFMKSPNSLSPILLSNATTNESHSRVRRHGTAVETDNNFVVWGMGKHACPGRFFAVDLVKIILANVLVHYDIQPLTQRPHDLWVEYNAVPSPTAVLHVRRRNT